MTDCKRHAGAALDGNLLHSAHRFRIPDSSTHFKLQPVCGSVAAAANWFCICKACFTPDQRKLGMVCVCVGVCGCGVGGGGGGGCARTPSPAVDSLVVFGDGERVLGTTGDGGYALACQHRHTGGAQAILRVAQPWTSHQYASDHSRRMHDDD